jgi:uncharacterized membrane protein
VSTKKSLLQAVISVVAVGVVALWLGLLEQLVLSISSLLDMSVVLVGTVAACVFGRTVFCRSVVC